MAQTQNSHESSLPDSLCSQLIIILGNICEELNCCFDDNLVFSALFLLFLPFAILYECLLCLGSDRLAALDLPMSVCLSG